MLLFCFKGETISVGDSSLSSKINLAWGFTELLWCLDLVGDVTCQFGRVKFFSWVGEVISLTPAAKFSFTFENMETLFGDLTLVWLFRRVKGFGTGASNSDSVNWRWYWVYKSVVPLPCFHCSSSKSSRKVVLSSISGSGVWIRGETFPCFEVFGNLSR